VSFRFTECTAPACILGETNVDLRDRVVATADVGAGSFLEVGAPATVNGDGFVGGDALIRSNGVVTGNLTLAGTLSTQGPSTVGGTLTENGDPTIPTLPTKTFATGSGFQEVTGVQTLAPGNFGDVVVRSNATVTLNAGTYNFASLNIETDVNLVVNGAVEVNVEGDFQLGDRSDVTGAGELGVYSNGGFVRIGTDATFSGILVAPNANVIVASRTEVDGCVGGENVTFDTDVTLASGGRTLPTGGTTTPEPPEPPMGELSAVAAVQADWGAGYCVHLEVTNESTTATSTWSLMVDLQGSIITGSWNGAFSGNSGVVTVGPGFDWNLSIPPGATNNSVGFYADRPAGAGTAVVTSATGTF
jgi:cellulase/cellobiase CelA1